MVFFFFSVAAPKIGINFNWVDVTSAASTSPRSSRRVVALTLYTSAFVCEALRSGVNAVPLGQAEAARAIGLPFGGSDAPGRAAPGVPRRRCRRWPACMIALLKNTSVAGRLRRDRGGGPDAAPSPTTTPTSGWGIFLAFALATSSWSRSSRSSPTSSSAVGGSPDERQQSSSTAPGPQTRRPHRIYTVVAVVALARARRLRREAARTTRAVRVRPVGAVRHPAATSRRSSSTACCDTLKMAFTAIIGAVVFGLVFGVGKLSDHRLVALAVLARRGVLPRRPVLC